MADPGGILGAIVARKRIDVAARLGGADPMAGAAPTRLSLTAALARPGARFVMEVKKASPSAGAIRPGADPAAQAAAYAGVADAVSVLTDGPFFGGALADLAAVRRAYDGPVLAKDFIVDPRQVAEARRHGADAVLAMLSVLGDDEARAVMAAAGRLGMDVLVEAHDESEVRRAVALGARLIGINNRDLRTLEVDLAVTERLAPLVPRDRLVVAESGIGSRANVERLAPFADAFLIGTALMRAERPAEAARALAFGRVKVCGVTNAADATAAIASGATHVGLVMVPGTPRAVTREQAAGIFGASLVGVFRNEKLMEVALSARALGLSAVQLHGEEDATYIRGLRALLPAATEIWAAGPVGRDVPEPRLGADRTLFDTQVGSRSGGTGCAFDWERVRGRPELGTALLAGGLDPGNARAASRVGAWALDICSGVEAAPGRKDHAKLGAFFEALRPEVRACA
ncbi:MAG TPA: bifunctional indole-3-glycerol-phosphate synthase TrpC/phosphoribosylanthranilate isomerase TrpF [Allosphingosinicella sp.]|jgi:indole-3-glycerol phosphate synthase/phosphoribosylanthranilate isomerase|nr:bifunctional indole-3-glycerol-phosphate synthase TrpC/phosphoribosylanthranilate isomerase TrpF [Allosphingosinicella sp.]